MRALLLVAAAGLSLGLIGVGCGSSETSPDDDDADTSSGTGGSTGVGSGGSGSGGGLTGLGQRTISGDITWNVTFDAAAQASGATDCSYTRHYEGVENSSSPWRCPQCEVVFEATVSMTAGQNDCYPQVSPNAPVDDEWIGWGNGVFYRGPLGLRLSDQGAATVAGTSLTSSNTVADLEATEVGAGTLGFQVDGTFTIGEQEGDPNHGFDVPETYACGWPKAAPAPYQGDYTLAIGQTMPDGVFLDSCGEAVRLHDFAGDYIVVDMSAIDCPPCNQKASEQEAFVQGMQTNDGITVHVITLLAPSLSDPLGDTSQQQLQSWISNYSISTPVLADRAWGLSLFSEAIMDAGYPSWALVSPNLEVLDMGTGYGGWDSYRSAILAHAGN